MIGTIHQASRDTYGAPRVHAGLVLGYGITVGHNTVSLLMRRAVLPARSRGTRTRRPITITGLVHRDLHRNGPNQLWMTDITEHPTREGKVGAPVGQRNTAPTRKMKRSDDRTSTVSQVT